MFLLGGISLIFPVHSDNEVHYAGVWGGTKIPASASDTEDYINSIKHYIEECNKMNVDISVQAHPFVERFQLFLQCIKAYAIGNAEKIKESL